MRRCKWWGVVLVMGLVVISLAGCEKPGEGRKAEQGYAAAAPVIEALAAYHTDHQAYPETLDALTPDYLAAVPQPAEMPPLRYAPTGQSYELTFEYVGPGMNRCVYTPEDGWRCSGYF